MEASRKRPLSPDPDAADQQTRFARDPSAALATFAPAPPSDRFNLPPLSSLTAFAGVPPPQLFVGSEQTPANVSNKRLRLDDDAGSQELFQGRRQSISMQGMQELPGIASITGRPGQITGQQLPPFQAGLESAPGTPGGDSEHRSAHPGQTSLPSFKTFGQEALGNLLGPGHFNSSDQSRFAGGSGSPHYSAPASTLGTAASSSLTSAAAAASSRMTLPPFNASSPVSKVPKPPSTILYKREPSSSSVTSGVGSLTRVPLPGSPLVSPILNPAAAPIPPPPASFFHSTSMSSPFSSGAFGVPPYGTNYYSSNMKRMEAERRDPSTVLSKLPPMSSLPGSRAASDLGEAESMHGSHSRRLAHRRGGAADVDDDDGSDGSNSDDLQMIDARTGKIRSQPDSDTGETLGRVLNMGSRKADMEKAKEEAKRKRKPGDVAVVNDERLTRVPRNMEEKHLGHIVYAGPRVRRPGCCRVEDVKLCLLPVFNSDHHYATIEIRIPAYLLTFKSNVAARLSAVWGTDVYTDDSDVVAMILHSGWYKAIDSPDLDRARLKANLSEPRPQESQVPLVTVKEEPSPADLGNPLDPAEATSNGTSTRPVTPVRTLPVPPLAPVMGTLDPSDGLPSHDLHVVLRILPRLVKYTGSLRNGVESRGWGSGHDGKSLRIERVFAVEKGSVSRHGKKAGSLAKLGKGVCYQESLNWE
ncbi:hypothetical protein HKX48_004509 [Thoreauomyces humboldtii]|nr:hypothetical protein HKX48_004509 [Thoreauomyces humboldtii]